jgi:hypothetical protein
LLAAAATLCALELTNRYYPPAAWIVGVVALVVIIVRLMILGRREP